MQPQALPQLCLVPHKAINEAEMQCGAVIWVGIRREEGELQVLKSRSGFSKS